MNVCRAPMTARIALKKTVGEIIGRVTYQNLLQMLAPSIYATSYNSLGTP